jgi:hypothetical protein
MTYKKPEMDIEKFDIIEEITGDGTSATTGGDGGGGGVNSTTVAADESIGSDLIIG